LRRVTHGPASPAVAAMASPRLSGAEWVAWGPLVLLALAIGLVPALVLGVAADPVAALTRVVNP
jgi:NADH-quinone oxidoreductase subunit M